MTPTHRDPAPWLLPPFPLAGWVLVAAWRMQRVLAAVASLARRNKPTPENR